MNKEDFFYKRIYLFFVFLEIVLTSYLVFIVIVNDEQFFFDVSDTPLEEDNASAPPKRKDTRWRDKWRNASPKVKGVTSALGLNTLALIFFGYNYWNVSRNQNRIPLQSNGSVPQTVSVAQEVQETVRVDDTKAKQTIENAVSRLEKDVEKTEKEKARITNRLSVAVDEEKIALEEKMGLIKEREKRNKEMFSVIERIVNNLKKSEKKASSKALSMAHESMPQEVRI